MIYASEDTLSVICNSAFEDPKLCCRFCAFFFLLVHFKCLFSTKVFKLIDHAYCEHDRDRTIDKPET